MGRRKRIQKSRWLYFVTNRCFQAKFILLPDQKTNAIIQYWLTRALKIYGVELFAGVFMSNHFHLIVRARRKNLHLFMAYLQRNIARHVNLHRKREDSVFPRRYSAEPILDDEALLDQVRYLLNNPVVANLVEEPGHWPGFTTWGQMVGGAENEDSGELPAVTQLPIWKDLAPEEYAERVQALALPQCHKLAEQRAEKGHTVVGADKVTKISWWHRPRKPKKTPRRPLCHASDNDTWQKHKQWVSRIHESYRHALEKWWDGEAVAFPKGTIPPGWSCCSDGTTKAKPHEMYYDAD